MPELAEVEFYRKQWKPGQGDRVEGVTLHGTKRIFRGEDLTTVNRLRGSKLLGSEAHGKRLLFRFSGGNWLGIHLGMTGKLRVEAPEFPPGKHDHLLLRQRKRSLVFSDPRLFGRVRFHHGKDTPPWWAGLPPVLSSAGFTRQFMSRFLTRHGRAPVKAVLLDQAGFPGVGNWMADEILWRAGILPQARAAQVTGARAAGLHKAVRWVASHAIKIIGSDFSDPPDTWLFGQRWKKKGHCPRDGSALKKATVGGRTTAWCSKCQR